MRGHLALKYNTEPKQQKAEEGMRKRFCFLFFISLHFAFFESKRTHHNNNNNKVSRTNEIKQRKGSFFGIKEHTLSFL